MMEAYKAIFMFAFGLLAFTITMAVIYLWILSAIDAWKDTKAEFKGYIKFIKRFTTK